MKKKIGVAALAVLTALTIGFAPGLARAERPGSSMISEGMLNIPGTVEMSHGGYLLQTSIGTFRLTGADAAPLVGQKVKAWGELSRNESTDVETLHVDQFVASRA
jgi:hypothetical protein